MSSSKALDLFSGIGGFHAAIQHARINVKVVGAVESDRFARQTYAAMYPTTPFLGFDDVRKCVRSPEEHDLLGPLPRRRDRAARIQRALPPVDLLCAGLPCQSHSLMGNRRGGGDGRGTLFFDVLEIVRALTPRFVVLENVRALKSVNGGALFNAVLSGLHQDLKYNVQTWVLDAQHYGVPQVRRRIFIIASTGRLPDAPPATIAPESRTWLTTWHLLERLVDKKYYLSDRILETVLKDQHKGYRRPAIINRLTARPLTRTMHKMHRASQDNYYSDDFINGDFDKEAWSVRHRGGQGPIRRITPREAFRIHSFPEPLVEAALDAGVSDTQLYMQAGNAVPPPLAAAVLGHLPW